MKWTLFMKPFEFLYTILYSKCATLKPMTAFDWCIVEILLL